MTDIEEKALALLNEISREEGMRRCGVWGHYSGLPVNSQYVKAICRAIEQHEAFKQEVSDAVEAFKEAPLSANYSRLYSFIIPAPKPDPLVEIIGELDDGTWGETKAEYAALFRAALEARGFEIREKV